MTGAPGKLETCLLSEKDKQLIHKLVIQALYSSRYNRANNKEDANCNTNSVSYKYRSKILQINLIIIIYVDRLFENCRSLAHQN